MLNTCSPSRSLEFGDVLSKEHLHDQPPVKSWSLSLSWAFLVYSTSYVLSLCYATGGNCYPERGLLEAHIRLPPDFASSNFISPSFQQQSPLLFGDVLRKNNGAHALTSLTFLPACTSDHRIVPDAEQKLEVMELAEENVRPAPGNHGAEAKYNL